MKEKLLNLKEKAERCKACNLWKKRNKVVFGEGPDNAKIVLIGLGPGYWENLSGKPFVGAAGKFLNKLLSLAKLKRKEVYITNIVKCYLPKNKVSKKQVNTCTSLFLNKQIETIKPKIIITLGNISTQYIFKKFNLPILKMSKIHGKVFEVLNPTFKGKVIPMYHPAAALRNPKLRTIIENDWKMLKLN